MQDDRIALVLGQGFEDSEFRVPYDRLRAAGYTVDVIGAKAGETLTGYRGKEKVKTDRGIDGVRADDFAALVIPGGQSPDHLRADRRFVDFVKAFDATKRPLAAVCHGPQLLITAGLVRGRTMTAWKTIQDDLRQIGARVIDEPVVEDGNWITSRQPQDLEAFSQAILSALAGTPRQRGDEPEEEEEPTRRIKGPAEPPSMSAGSRSSRSKP
jgi:protease I